MTALHGAATFTGAVEASLGWLISSRPLLPALRVCRLSLIATEIMEGAIAPPELGEQPPARQRQCPCIGVPRDGAHAMRSPLRCIFLG